MNFLRLHWFDLGIVLAVIVAVYVAFSQPAALLLLLWLNLIALFLHQAEEYRWPGYFPGMINTVMYASSKPDRYPLNTNTAMLVNVLVGWVSYLLAAVFAERSPWLGIATILVSFGNLVAHTVLFNVRGKTVYNPGMATALVLFLPLILWFFGMVIQGGLASPLDWVLGLVLGAVLNYVGILKLIDWLKDEQTPYIFPKRFLIPSQRNS